MKIWFDACSLFKLYYSFGLAQMWAEYENCQASHPKCIVSNIIKGWITWH